MNGTDPNIYETTFRETETPALITGTDFRIRDANEACLDLSGYERSELVGETPAALFDQQSVYEEIVEVVSRGESWQGEFEAMTKDGRLISGRGSCVPITDDGERRGYAAFFSDRTQHQQYERSLRILNRVLRHNLRNDANVVLGHIEIVSEGLEDERLRESLSTAHHRMHSLVKYAETARNLEELISERTDPTLSPVRIDEVVRDELRAARNTYPGAEFESELAAEPTYVAADEALGMIFEAVFSNAVEHNDSRIPHVSVRFEHEDRHLTVTVVDDGSGVSEDEHDLVFGREEVSQLHHGQGLDLFFVDLLMEKYGGDVWVENDGGAAFHLRFRTVSRPDESA